MVKKQLLDSDVESDDESDKAVINSTALGHRRFVDDDLSKNEWEVTPQKFRAGIPMVDKHSAAYSSMLGQHSVKKARHTQTLFLMKSSTASKTQKEDSKTLKNKTRILNN